MGKHLVLIGEERYEEESTNRYQARKQAAEKFKEKFSLDVPTSDIAQYYAKDYSIPDPQPEFSTESILKELKKKKEITVKAS